MNPIAAVLRDPSHEFVSERHRFLEPALLNQWATLATQTPGQLQRKQASELEQRIEIVVDVAVTQPIVVLAGAATLSDHEHRGRLPAAAIAAGIVARLECGKQSLGSSPCVFSNALDIASAT
jgi:hypothetical protein